MDNNKLSNQKLVSLQALRFWAFLGIFLEHSTWTFFRWSTISVSIFFVLSGFVLTYNYYNKEIHGGLKSSFLFALRRIKRLYPLHIITTLIMLGIPICQIIFTDSAESILSLLIKLFLNVFLIQSAVPILKYSVSLNGVSWFLSTSLFLYFFFPYYLKKIKRKNSYFDIFFVYMFQIIFAVCTYCLFGFDDGVFTWATYINPVFRLGDFIIGCNLGVFYLKSNKNTKSILKPTILSLFVIVQYFIIYIFFNYNFNNNYIKVFQNWTTIFLTCSPFIVCLFAFNNSLITRIMVNKITVQLGNISNVMFLIHYVITQYVKAIIIFKKLDITNVSVNNILALFELIMTIVMTIIYIRIIKLIDEKRKLKNEYRLQK